MHFTYIHDSKYLHQIRLSQVLLCYIFFFNQNPDKVHTLHLVDRGHKSLLILSLDCIFEITWGPLQSTQRFLFTWSGVQPTH